MNRDNYLRYIRSIRCAAYLEKFLNVFLLSVLFRGAFNAIPRVPTLQKV